MKRRDFLRSCGAVALYSPQAFAAALDAAGPRRTLVLGGTAFALGYALAHPGETLVLERGIHLGAEFALTGDPDRPGTPATPSGRALEEGLRQAGILSGDRLECPPLADYLSVFFAERGGRSFMNAELADVRRTKDGWQVEVYGGGSDGLQTFTVARILDTTDLGWRQAGRDAVTGKRLSAQTTTGPFHVSLPAAADWRTARLALDEAWRRRRPSSSVLLAEAGALKCLYGTARVERCTPDGIRWIPSAQFPTLMAAFEEGASWTWR